MQSALSESVAVPDSASAAAAAGPSGQNVTPEIPGDTRRCQPPAPNIRDATWAETITKVIMWNVVLYLRVDRGRY